MGNELVYGSCFYSHFGPIWSIFISFGKIVFPFFILYFEWLIIELVFFVHYWPKILGSKIAFSLFHFGPVWLARQSFLADLHTLSFVRNGNLRMLVQLIIIIIIRYRNKYSQIAITNNNLLKNNSYLTISSGYSCNICWPVCIVWELVTLLVVRAGIKRYLFIVCWLF